MKNYYIVLECVWGTEEDKDYVRRKYNLCLMDISKLYNGPDEVDIFIGKKAALIKYIKECYLADECDLEEYLEDIKEV